MDWETGVDIYTLCHIAVLSHIRLLATSWTVVCQASLSMGFSRKVYWSGLPFPSPGDLPNLGDRTQVPVSPALVGRFFTTPPSGKPSNSK